ncbi:nucleotide disphospho-sugar-binding domain-containing protein [Streptomyces avermitilis]|uniref:nucleotide disphospho-sugar-binding domain-containing protein n=1 Tax=Streptomyces avermitilis TaxID=33903 RepID=UPI0037214E7B
MRVLFVVTPIPGHLSPLTPLAWALRGAGHEVLVAGQPDVMATAAKAGLTAVSVGDPFGMEALMRGFLPIGLRPIQCWEDPSDEERSADFARAWAAHNELVLPGYLEVARAFDPQLIVSDVLEYSSLIVGRALDVPVVQHRWGVDPLSGPTRIQARLHHRALVERLKLPGLPDPVMLLDPCPPSLQVPRAEPGTPIRHVHAHGNAPVPAWIQADRAARAARTAQERRRVVVSMGRSTLALNGSYLLRGILRAFEELPDVEAFVTVGGAFREEVETVPDNVRLIDPTPLHLLLDTSDAVLHHGGAGTTMSASWCGLPQLVLPQLADQFAHARQVAATGAGLALHTAEQQDDPEQITTALAELLADPGYAKAAGELRREMELMPAPSQVVSGLERLV